MQRSEKTMDKVVALAKNRGFVFPGSEIYGGLANTWDYGPLASSSKITSKKRGGANLLPSAAIMSAWTALF